VSLFLREPSVLPFEITTRYVACAAALNARSDSGGDAPAHRRWLDGSHHAWPYPVCIPVIGHGRFNYADFAASDGAIPVVPGCTSESELLAGADPMYSNGTILVSLACRQDDGLFTCQQIGDGGSGAGLLAPAETSRTWPIAWRIQSGSSFAEVR
jgi:hypothetical protein